ncbi:MAG: hypothetical protein VX899_10760 [Myxococcota bacterium]|nr:hypothetical protein [Myxococcota bacterium]
MPVKPFTPDPEIMERIRPMMHIDAEPVARLHHAAMGNSLWAQLGVPFLEALYKALMADRRFMGFVYLEQGRVRGFIAGSLDTQAMMDATFARAKVPLALAAGPGVLRSPRTIPKLLQTFRYKEVSGVGGEIPGESLFISFEPDLRGRGAAKHINKVLFDELLARGHQRVKITTELDNEPANRQLQSWGFQDSGHFSFYGKEMVCYVLELASSPRVDPVSRHPTV